MDAVANLAGSTLFELVLVMVMISILMVVAAPSLRGFLAGSKSRDASENLLSITRLARERAIADRAVYRLFVDPQAGTYWLHVQQGEQFVPLGTDFGQTYTLPEGMRIELSRVDHIVAGSWIDFHPERAHRPGDDPADELAERADGDPLPVAGGDVSHPHERGGGADMTCSSSKLTCGLAHLGTGATPSHASDRRVRPTDEAEGEHKVRPYMKTLDGRNAHAERRGRGMHRPCGRAARGGFTLMEVLAAIVLVGIVVPVAMEAISLSMRGASDAKRKVEAAMLAENKLTELTAGLAMQSMGSGMASGMASGGAMAGDFAPDWPEFRWEAARSEREVDLSEIQVRVIWTSRGEDRFVSLSTMVYTGTGMTTDSTGGILP